MRIVNIVLGVFFLLLAVLPLVTEGATPTSIVYVVGRLVAGVTLACVFALVAWLGSGREEPAREAGIGIGLMVALLSILAPVSGRGYFNKVDRANERNERAWRSDPNSLENHPYVDADPESDEGRAYAALVARVEDMRLHTAQFQSVADEALVYDVSKIGRMSSVVELQEARNAVEEYGKAAEKQEQFLNGVREAFEEDLISRDVDKKIRDRMLGEFTPGDLKSLQAIKVHQMLANHTATLLGILITDWGKWTTAPNPNRFEFQNQDTKKSFNTLTGLIQECEQKIKNATQKTEGAL